MYTQRCPVCHLPSVSSYNGSLFEIDCACCGEFSLTKRAQLELSQQDWEAGRRASCSWFLRRNPGFAINTQSLSILERVRTLDVNEKGVALLLFLAEAHPRPSSYITEPELRINPDIFDVRRSEGQNHPRRESDKELKPLHLLAVTASIDRTELDWLIENYLLKGGLLIKEGSQHYCISLKGWELINQQNASNPQSRDAFIAMSFHDRFLPLYEQALFPGIRSAGYEAVRIDRKEHNNRIDDEIIASIRKSRFLVADFSMHRGGIYFEAGFALGLGLPVIWTVEKCALDKGEVHFDNRQYNFLVWEDGKYDDLARRLTNRIEATIGRPLVG
jgi:nucleoside 2-deoxyribosyltransferase